MAELDQDTRVENPNQILEELIGGKPDVVYLMSGGIAKGSNTPYKSTSMRDPDLADGKKFGYLGGALRTYAVAELHRYFPPATIITSSKVNGISHAQVHAKELRALWEKWGIQPPENILLEEHSQSTRTELAELIRLILDQHMTGRVVAVTNDYHIPRARLTLDNLPRLMEKQDPAFKEIWSRWEQYRVENDISLTIQDAEPILSAVNPKFDKMLSIVFEKEPWKSYRQTRLEAEKRGVEAIENNLYDSEQVRNS